MSLGVSYWINSWLTSIVILIVASAVKNPVTPAENPVGYALTASIVWISAIAIILWQLVGVWRSAGKHKGRGGRGFWVGMARFLVVTGFLGLAATLTRETVPQLKESWSIAFGDPGVGMHALYILRNGTEVEYAGGITFGASGEVRKLLDADPSIRVVQLNSNGGRVAEARKLRDLIRERRLITYTATACASACTIAFIGGVQRYIAPGAKLGFHRGSFPGLSDDQLDADDDIDRRSLIAAGIPAWFVTRAYSTPSTSIWWPTSDELRRAGVITGIARPDDFAVSGSSANGPVTKP